MIGVVGDRDDVAAGDSGYRGFWFDLPDEATLGQALRALYDERCMPLMSAPWVVHLLDPSVTVIRDDIGRVQHIRYDWTGEAVAAARDTSVVLLHRSWGLRTPLADTGRQLPTGEYAFYLRYVPLGGPYDVDALRG